MKKINKLIIALVLLIILFNFCNKNNNIIYENFKGRGRSYSSGLTLLQIRRISEDRRLAEKARLANLEEERIRKQQDRKLNRNVIKYIGLKFSGKEYKDEECNPDCNIIREVGKQYFLINFRDREIECNNKSGLCFLTKNVDKTSRNPELRKKIRIYKQKMSYFFNKMYNEYKKELNIDKILKLREITPKNKGEIFDIIVEEIKIKKGEIKSDYKRKLDQIENDKKEYNKRLNNYEELIKKYYEKDKKYKILKNKFDTINYEKETFINEGFVSRSDLDETDTERQQAHQTALDQKETLTQLNKKINTDIKEVQTLAAVLGDKLPTQIEKPKETTGYNEPIDPYVARNILGAVLGGLTGLSIIIYFGLIFLSIKLSEKKLFSVIEKKFELYDYYKKIKEYDNTNWKYKNREEFEKYENTDIKIRNFIDQIYYELKDSSNEEIDEIKKELLNQIKNDIKSKFSFFNLVNNYSKYKNEVEKGTERELEGYKELKNEGENLINLLKKEEYGNNNNNTVGGNLKKLKKILQKNLKKNRKTKNDKLTRRLIKKIKKTKKTKNNYKKYK